MKNNFKFDNLTDASCAGVRYAMVYVGGKRVSAVLDNRTVYVDGKPTAYFYGCSPDQLRELFHQVVRQLEQQSTNS